MLVNLRNSAGEGLLEIDVTDRVPNFIEAPCRLVCEYHLQHLSNYSLLTCTISSPVDSPLTLICQRCLASFKYSYSNTTTIALCKSEEQALALRDDYTCIVIENNRLDFTELVTDDLYLYVPENHPDFSDCDEDVSQFINAN